MDAGSWPKPANPSLLSSSIMHQPGSDTASKLEMSSLQEVWEKKKKKKEFTGNHSYLFKQKSCKAKLTIIKQTAMIYCSEVWIKQTLIL